MEARRKILVLKQGDHWLVRAYETQSLQSPYKDYSRDTERAANDLAHSLGLPRQVIADEPRAKVADYYPEGWA